MAAGGNADEMLGRIIKDYIEEELANAEQERVCFRLVGELALVKLTFDTSEIPMSCASQRVILRLWMPSSPHTHQLPQPKGLVNPEEHIS
jgi:hypothetical protein